MPQVTVYVREEDLDAWKAIEKKSEFIHEALNRLEMAYNAKDKTVAGKSIYSVLETEEISSNIRPVIKKIKRIDNVRLNKDGTLSPVDSSKKTKFDTGVCPHGSAKGFCKKAECNKKFR